MIAQFPINPKELTEVIIGENTVTIPELVAVARYGARVRFSDKYRERVIRSRKLIDKFLDENRLIYGVTTGFGSNVDKVISAQDAATLQTNIVRSHAVSVGRPLDMEVVRAIQFTQLVSLGLGYSGVRIEVLDAIADLLNHQIIPVTPGEGSVGYLSPEAHMALVLMGEGKATYRGETLLGKEALLRAGLRPIELQCKEGLTLLSGSNSSTGMAALAHYDATQTVKTADIVGAMSLEGLRGTVLGLDERLHGLKRHPEQFATAQYISKVLNGSEISERYKRYRLQDALSLRCIPQVHGAVKQVLLRVEQDIVNEMNSVSDNPVLYPEDGDGIALMGGNFDASYVGMAADTMAIALVNLAKVSERRSDRLVNHHVSELPPYLVSNPGLNSGYMITQYTAAGLLAEIKILAHPATVDNIPTSANQEDAVSFAYCAAKKAREITQKVEHILAIELMLATQALDFHHPLQPSPVTGAIHDTIRRDVPTLSEDRFLYPDIELIMGLIHEGEILKIADEMVNSAL